MNEQELRAKYRSIQIVAGSLKAGRGKHKGKNTVTVKCRCSHSLVCCTSDLWLRNCPACGEKLNRTRKPKGAK